MLAYSCRKSAVQIFVKKNFSGLHLPLSELVPRLPPHPFGDKNTAISQYVKAPIRPTLYQYHSKNTQKSALLTKC